MRDSLEYLIRKQCPEYLHGTESTSPSTANDYKNDLNSYWTAANCSKYPDVGKKYCNLVAKETLENQRHPRENGAVMAGQYWIDGR